MTRSEAYAEGWAEGRAWAEGHIRDYHRQDPERGFWAGPQGHSYDLGIRRGYRDTWARWDSGALTWEMLEHAPVNR